MEEVRADGERRIDRLLSEHYLADLASRTLDDVRALRDEADQEEADLSYLRRLLQARLDLVENEMDRRQAGDPVPDDIVAYLTTVLTDGPRSGRGPAQHLGRHRAVEPSNAGENRRHVEQLVSDSLLTDLPARTDDELSEARRVLRKEEAALSERRTSVQRIADAVGHEIGRRYRDGEATVATLLEHESG